MSESTAPPAPQAPERGPRAFLNDFREFAVKGNVLDMAVGILVGVAFNKIVQSLVNDIFMPPIGMVLGGVEFKDLKLVLRPEVVVESSNPVAPPETIPEVAIRYGQFINTCIEFVIIALAAFIAVRVMTSVMRKRQVA
jgi:large conductance mechanosensitive channel